MTQLTFDSFIREEDKSAPHSNPVVNSAATNQYVLVLILKDFSVAWTDRNWYLHDQDLVYIDQRLASLLVERGIARRTEVS